MKKIITALVIIAGIFTLSSCSKSCYCKAVVNGEEILGKIFDNEDSRPCSDYNYYDSVLGQTTEYRCVIEL